MKIFIIVVFFAISSFCKYDINETGTCWINAYLSKLMVGIPTAVYPK